MWIPTIINGILLHRQLHTLEDIDMVQVHTGDVPICFFPFICFDLQKAFTNSYDELLLETDIADADDLSGAMGRNGDASVANVGDDNEGDYSTLKVTLGEGHVLQDILRSAIDTAKDVHAEKMAKLRGVQGMLHKGHIDTAVEIDRF